MKKLRTFLVFTLIVVLAAWSSPTSNKPEKADVKKEIQSKYPEQVPEGYFINNRTMDTRIGELEFENGFPTEATTATLFEYRTFYRAVEAFTQNTFAASLYAMRKGYADFGLGKPYG